MSSTSQPLSQVHIPPQTGGGIVVRRDQRFKVTAVKGKQVADLFAFVLDTPDEMLSQGHTRSKLRRLTLKLGDSLYSNKRSQLMVIEEDLVGVHDLLAPACDTFFYEEQGMENHPSCRSNLVATLEKHEFVPVSLPDPINLFQNTPIVDLEGNRETRESLAKPGDYVLFRVFKDLLVIATACSVDLPPLNGGEPSDLMLEVYA